MWTYQNKIFESSDIQDHLGMVYLITHLPSKKKYIGQKKFISERTLPPLKGKTRKRKVKKESDWQSYYGSNNELKAIAATEPSSNFKREILHLCPNKATMNYLELYEQVTRDVLLDDQYFNDFIGGKITSRGLDRNAMKTLHQTA